MLTMTINLYLCNHVKEYMEKGYQRFTGESPVAGERMN